MNDIPPETKLEETVQGGIGHWPEEPLRILEANVDPLLLWAAQKRATDITLQTDRPVYIEVDGTLHPVTRRNLDSADMVNVLARIYGPDALAKLAAGQDLDLSYEVRPERNTRYRFRTNITASDLSRGRDPFRSLCTGCRNCRLPRTISASRTTSSTIGRRVRVWCL